VPHGGGAVVMIPGLLSFVLHACLVKKTPRISLLSAGRGCRVSEFEGYFQRRFPVTLQLRLHYPCQAVNKRQILVFSAFKRLSHKQ